LFPLLTAEELKDKSILSTILFYDARNEYVPGGKAFNYVVDNFKMLDSLQLVKYPLGIMENGSLNGIGLINCSSLKHPPNKQTIGKEHER